MEFPNLPLPDHQQDILATEHDTCPTVSLLESGLDYIRQGRHAQGVAYFALARERLSPDLMHLAAVLDKFFQDYLSYWQSQQALHQAREHFIEAQTKQQAWITSLEKLLPSSVRDVDNETSTGSPQLLKNSGEPQVSQPPQSLQPLFTDAVEQQLSAFRPSGQTEAEPSETNSHANNDNSLPALYFTCFGHFEVKRLGQTVPLCSNRNGQAILRYLVAQSGHRVSKDTLMALLWPEDEPEVAHHKLQVAISALRRSLNNGYLNDTGGGYILCKNGVYQLNPAVALQSDAEEFLTYYQAGRRSTESAAVTQYEAACCLYTGPFLTEDLYVDWPLIQREQLGQAYLGMCAALAKHYLTVGNYEDALKWANAILKENPYDEAAHQQLFRIYATTGRRSEALRQYQRCERILAEELGVSPMPETVSLFHTLLSSETPPR
jgi:DNA-binding SARP family transcriptional activator